MTCLSTCEALHHDFGVLVDLEVMRGASVAFDTARISTLLCLFQRLKGAVPKSLHGAVA